MAPLKTHPNILTSLALKDIISTRSKVPMNIPQIKNTKDVVRPKRKADCSPSKENRGNNKRKPMGDRDVNATEMKIKAADDKQKKVAPVKKATVQVRALPSVKTVQKQRQNENLPPPQAPGHKIVTRAAVKNVVPNQTAVIPKEVLKETNAMKVTKRLSNEFEKTEETLYCTALEEVAKKQHNLRSSRASESPPCDKLDEKDKEGNMTMIAKQIEVKLNLGNHEVPEDVEDYDKENWDDIFQVSHYAMDIFNYLKDRESQFEIPDYMDRQVCLSRWMRSLLVDWMVEIQESFELNHETLYLGVKLVDMYLSKMTVGKETLQLVGAAAMFVASKYDERIPPLIDDFLYICDGAYSRRELVRMEVSVLKVCGFDLGIPISYRFLRRYARCARITMPVLTLARYVLEYSLMNYDTITIRDSKLASAALYLAFKMKNISGWTKTLEFYTGYKLEEFKDVAILLNTGLQNPPKSQLMTVRNKYSHKIFFEVAKTPLISNDDL
ncbi:cyclin B3 isoform X2 [Leptinotarsa decemlineata]|uniref:cyclin B3 isoform X2 n=1 Tax=Leptinotarsa decemlineata TaxID=7539 RepID=UPI000C2521A2|nr:G2/mitotic-specific cyclin-B3 isoform X2 [Leptinotarsa decemlineata]